MCARPSVAKQCVLAWCSHAAPLSSTKVRWVRHNWPSATLDPGPVCLMSVCCRFRVCHVVPCLQRHVCWVNCCFLEQLGRVGSSPVQALLLSQGGVVFEKKTSVMFPRCVSRVGASVVLCAGRTLSSRPGVVLVGSAQPYNKCCSRCVLHCQTRRTVVQLLSVPSLSWLLLGAACKVTRAPQLRACFATGLRWPPNRGPFQTPQQVNLL